MVSSVDFFYVSLGFGFLILVGFTSYSLYQLAMAIKVFQSVINDVAETTHDITSLKNGIKTGFMKLALNWLTKFSKGGE